MARNEWFDKFAGANKISGWHSSLKPLDLSKLEQGPFHFGTKKAALDRLRSAALPRWLAEAKIKPNINIAEPAMTVADQLLRRKELRNKPFYMHKVEVGNPVMKEISDLGANEVVSGFPNFKNPKISNSPFMSEADRVMLNKENIKQLLHRLTQSLSPEAAELDLKYYPEMQDYKKYNTYKYINSFEDPGSVSYATWRPQTVSKIKSYPTTYAKEMFMQAAKSPKTYLKAAGKVAGGIGLLDMLTGGGVFPGVAEAPGLMGQELAEAHAKGIYEKGYPEWRNK